jgi:hypothetical protein
MGAGLMSYRLLLTATTNAHVVHFRVSGGDFGDMLSAKDHMIAQLMTREPGLTPTPDDALEFMANNLPVLPEANISVLDWTTAQQRLDWIETYADREYRLDMETGEVTSPDWSAQMDQRDSERNAA